MQHALYLCLYFFTLALPTSVVAEEIPCDVDNHTLVSHNTYTITDCTRRDGSPFLLLVSARNTSNTLLNVSVVVTFGRVLPMLFLDNTSHVENVTVHVVGARVNSVGLPLIQSNAKALTMVYIAASHLTARAVTLSVTNVTVVMNTESWKSIGSLDACLLLMVTTTESSTVDGVQVLVKDSTVLQRFNSTEYTSLGMVNVAVGPRSTVRHVNVTIQQSTIQVFANFSLQVTFRIPLSPNLVIVHASTSGPSGSNGTNIYYATTGTVLLQIELYTVGSALNSTNSAAYALTNVDVFGVHNLDLSGAHITLGPGTHVVVACECSRICVNQNIDAGGGILSAHVVSIKSYYQRSLASDLLIHFSGLFATARSASAAILLDTYLMTIHHCAILVLNSTFDSNLGGFYIGTEIRASSVVHFSFLVVAEVTITMVNVSSTSIAESGGCSSVFVACFSCAGNVSHVTVSMTTTSISSFVTVGVVAPLSLYGINLPFTLSVTASNLLSLLVPNLFSAGIVNDIIIRISNSSVVAGHTTGIPLLSTSIVVLSSISAVSLLTSVLNSNILIEGVQVQRTRPLTAGSETWLSRTFTGGAINTTSLVTAVDPSGLMHVLLPAFSWILSSLIGLATSTSQINVSVTIRGCNVSYATDLIPGSADVPTFFFSPSALVTSNYTIQNSSLLRPASASITFQPLLVSGAFMAVLSNATITATTISFVNCSAGSSALFLAKYSTTSFVWNRSHVDTPSMRIMFTGVTATPAFLEPATSLFSTSNCGIIRFVILRDAAIESTFEQANNRSLPQPLISVMRSKFEGFRFVFSLNHTVIEESPQRLNNSNNVVLLEVGCTNLWNHEPMPLEVAAEPHSLLLSYAAFPSIGSLGYLDCPSVIDEGSFTVSAGAAGSVAAVVYLSTVYSGSSVLARVSATSLQRSMQVLRLWQRCRAVDDGSPSENTSPPLFSDLSDNILGISLPFVDDETFDYAAGAAFGNAIFVVALGALFHILLVAKKRFGQSVTRSPIVWLAMDMTPSTRLPGSMSDNFGKLLQPSMAACAALLFGRSSPPIVCGAILVFVWLSYPIACTHAVLWRGRHSRQFLLKGAKVRPRQAAKTDDGAVTIKQDLTRLVDFSTSPTQEWKPRPGGNHRGTKERQYARYLLSNLSPVFEAFVERREWYFMVEWGVSILSGIVLGAAMAVAATGSDEEACSAAQWGTYSAIAFSALQVLFCATLRPFSVRLELWMAILVGGLELLGNVLVASGEEVAADSVVTTSATLELIVIVVTTVLTHLLAYDTMSEALVVRATASAEQAAAVAVGHTALKKLERYSTQLRSVLVATKAIPTSTVTTKATSLEQLRSLIELICSQQAAESNTPNM